MSRILAVVVGAPRKGKTFFSERTAIGYANAGGVAIAYNVGMPKDFADFISISLITPTILDQMAREKRFVVKYRDLPTDIQMFRVNETGQIYHLRDFVSMFRGKCVKIERLNPKYQEERMFYKCVFQYFYNCLLIMDDFRASTRNGLSGELIELLSRSNHTGSKVMPPGATSGVDIMVIYHSFENVVEEIYTYSTSVIQFLTTSPPDLKYYRELNDQLNEAYQWLRSAPKYSRVEIDFYTLTNKKFPN